MKSLRSWIRIPIGIGLALAPSIAWSATVNVTDGPSLQAALTAAETDNNPTTIILAPGTYDASGGTFNYFGAAAKDAPLTIQGSDPSTTILTGLDQKQVMNIDLGGQTSDANSDIVIQGLTFQHGNSSGLSGGGLIVLTDNADITLNNSIFTSNTTVDVGGGADLETGVVNSGTGNINASGNLFVGNTSTGTGAGGGAEFFSGGGGSIVAANNIFFKNQSDTIAGGLLFQFGALATAGGSLTLVNNTLTGNTAVGDGGGINVAFVDPSETINLYNNIIFGNTSSGGTGQDIFIEDGGIAATINLFNSDFSDVCFGSTGIACDPTGLANVGNNINQDPLLVDPTNGDFNLGVGSKAIDTGDSAAPNLPTVDYAGNPRIIGPAPDMGALEALPDIDVTPTSLNFGTVATGEASTLILTITNNGAGVLEVASLTPNNAAYTVDPTLGANPCGSLTPTLANGESCTVGVILESATEGTFNSTIAVDSNDPDEAQVAVPVTGVVGGIIISGSGCALTDLASPSLSSFLVLSGLLPILVLRKKSQK